MIRPSLHGFELSSGDAVRALLLIAPLALISAELLPTLALSQPAAGRGRAVPPVPLTSHTPTEADYPVESRWQDEQGTVRVRYVVSQTGDVSECNVEGTSGYERLDKAACVFVGRWRFRPATLRGNPVAANMRANVVFQKVIPRSSDPAPTIFSR